MHFMEDYLQIHALLADHECRQPRSCTNGHKSTTRQNIWLGKAAMVYPTRSCSCHDACDMALRSADQSDVEIAKTQVVFTNKT